LTVAEERFVIEAMRSGSFAKKLRTAPSRSAVASCGREFQRAHQPQSQRNPVLCQRENPQDCWKPAIQLDEEPAIKVREPNATTPPAAQDYQLMSQHRVLGFKSQLRLEWRSQDGQGEAEQPDHPASFDDSNAASHSDQAIGTHR
jgi:hypothetical protein